MQIHVAIVHEGKNPFKCENCDYSCLLKDNMQQHVTSVHKGSTSKSNSKICKSTWRGTKCLVTNCTNVHIAPCQDRECQALDGGLPLYKTRNCQLWHVRQKTKPKSKKPNSSQKNPSVSPHSSAWNHPSQIKRQHLQCQNHKRFDNPKGKSKPHSSNNVKNGNNQNKTFRPPSFVNVNHPQTFSYSSVVKGQKSHVSPMAHVSNPGNEVAAAAHQPLNRGGVPNQTWGQQLDQNQILMITEIVMQLMKRN